MDKQGDTRMALVEIDLVPYLEDEDWDMIDRVARKRLKHVDLSCDKLFTFLAFSISVNYYDDEVASAKENLNE